jgi:hypothetical protein
MKLTLEPTDQIVDVGKDGHARNWVGTDEHGTRVYALILGIAVHWSQGEEAEAAFGEALKEVPASTFKDHGPWPLRLFAP